MAKMGRTLYIRGFPDNMDPDRLVDKLQIHFLREKNGGGEITSINLKPADRCAIISFEHSSVALSVFQHRPQILEVDGRKYELTLSYPWQVSPHLNKVILDVSVTIDCKHLPQGMETIKMLAETFPELRVHYIKPQMHCSLRGPYPEIHAAVSHLMEFLEGFNATGQESCGLHSKKDGFKHHYKASPSDQPHGLYVSQINSAYPDTQNYKNILPVDPVLQGNSANLHQAHPDERIKDWRDANDEEALSLIMEADIFAYLSSKSKEYRRILQDFGVCVVDVTSEGVTTLYLQSKSKSKTGSNEENHINQARKELSQLYQQLESNLRRAQIPRSVLGLHGGSTEAFKDLQLLLPKVVLSLDQSYVYLVGEMSEVSQAKQILLLGSLDKQEKDLTAKEDTSASSNPSNSPTSEPEGARADILSSVMCPKLSNSGTGQKRRACEEYKLAARFRNSEMGIQGFRPKERGRVRECQDLNSTMASTFRPSPPSRSCLGTEGLANSLTGAGANQREDILPRRMDPLCFTGTLKTSGSRADSTLPPCTSESEYQNQNITSGSRANSTLPPCTSESEYQNQNITSGSRANSTLPPCTSSNALSDLDRHIKSLVSIAESSTTSTSSLKRVNSFSGLPTPKQVNEENGISESERSGSITRPCRRTRSSSLSRVKTVSRELIVPAVMWNYMNAAYHSDINALISDLKVSESPTDKYKVVVGLKGTDSSTVEERQHQLQELVDRVASDFCVKQLKLADLGVAKYDEVLESCCSHIRSRFFKVLIQSLTDTLVLSGPKSLCSQAIKILKEVFHSEVSNSGPLVNITHKESIDQGRAKTPSYTSVQSNSQITPNLTSKNTEENMAGQFEAFQSEHWKPSSMQPQKTVVKEKLKMDGLEHLKTSKSSTLESKSSRVNEGILFDRLRSSTPTTQKSISAASVTGKQTSRPVHTQPETCVCGKSSQRVVQTSCGVFLCPQCLPIHAQCMTCSKVKAVKETLPDMPVHSHRVEQKIEKVTGKEASKGQKREQGIHGTMTIVELSLTLPGHDRYPTAKVTYRIPEGIQGEEHPNPGSPFQGGVFEAYLPLNSKGRALLQCLDKAFKQGLIFTVCSGTKTGSTAKVAWNRIPHKTNISGGKSGNGYPDSTYLNDLSEALKACGIDAV